MERRQVAALTPLRRGSMVSHFEEDRELFERRQRRGRLAGDLLEGVVEGGGGEAEGDEAAGQREGGGVAPEVEAAADAAPEEPLKVVADLGEEEPEPVARVAVRTPLEMVDWGEAPHKLDEAEPELADLELG